MTSRHPLILDSEGLFRELAPSDVLDLSGNQLVNANGVGSRGFTLLSQDSDLHTIYTLPIDGGNNSQVMTTLGDGSVVWRDVLTASDNICQGVLSSGSFTVSNQGSNVVIPFSAYSDPKGWWNSSTNKFQPNVPGTYLITFGTWWSAGQNGTMQINTQIAKNGNTYAIAQNNNTTTNGLTQCLTRPIYFNGSTDYIQFTAYTSDTANQTINRGTTDGSGTNFSAVLLTNGSRVFEMDSEIADRKAADLVLTNAIAQETKNRSDADSDFGVQLQNEINTRFANVSSLLSLINAETIARANADSDLKAQLTSSLSASIATEVANRLSADSDISKTISTEVADRLSYDSIISASIATEVANRLSADSDIGRIINIEVANRLSSDSDMLVIISAAASVLRADNDSDIAVVNTSIDATNALIATEVSTRTANVSTLLTLVQAETAARANADSDIAATLTSKYNVTQESQEFNATDSQTIFTLSYTPLGKVQMFRNGVRVKSSNTSVTDTTFVYIPPTSQSLVAGDEIVLDYIRAV